VKCPNCSVKLIFRRWSDRLPRKSEALAECPVCEEKWQVRYFDGKPSSKPYQVRKSAEPKKNKGSYRIKKSRRMAIEAIWGSVQKYLDHSVIQPGMTQQYKT